jgi:hypothetical protein
MQVSNPRKTTLQIGLAAALFSMTAGSAFATNGYFAHGYGTKARGMGGASTALAQDGFAGANNPAAAAFAGNRWDAGADLFSPDRAASRTGGAGPMGPYFAGNATSKEKHFVVPEFGYNLALSDRMGLGLTDLPPINRATGMLVKSDTEGVVGHEEAIYGRADHWFFEGSRGRDAGKGAVSQTRVLGCGVLRVAKQVWWHGGG